MYRMYWSLLVQDHLLNYKRMKNAWMLKITGNRNYTPINVFCIYMYIYHGVKHGKLQVKLQ